MVIIKQIFISLNICLVVNVPFHNSDSVRERIELYSTTNKARMRNVLVNSFKLRLIVVYCWRCRFTIVCLWVVVVFAWSMAAVALSSMFVGIISYSILLSNLRIYIDGNWCMMDDGWWMSKKTISEIMTCLQRNLSAKGRNISAAIDCHLRSRRRWFKGCTNVFLCNLELTAAQLILVRLLSKMYPLI